STKEECYLDSARYGVDVNSSSGSNPGALCLPLAWQEPKTKRKKQLVKVMIGKVGDDNQGRDLCVSDFGTSIQHLALSKAWRVWKEGKGQLLIDQNLVESCPLTEALRWINIALLCVQENPTDRPAMSTVVFMLGGQLTSLPQPSEPPFSVGRLDIFEQSSVTGEGTGFFPSDHDSTSASLF
ncbi:hypothetical protein RJ639_042768, partial [Escallonia herrerae]